MGLSKKRFIWSATIATLVLLLFVILLDTVIMPAWVHSATSVKVPNVVGLQKDIALDRVESQGLKIGQIIEQFNEKIPKGQVISQNPNPNSEVKEGRRVYLTVSRGYEVATVPDLYGKNERDVRIILMQAGLEMGTATWKWKDSVPEDRVVEQSLPPGLNVSLGAVVNIVLSKDSTNTVIMPSLIKLTESEAREVLRINNLNLGSVSNRADETIEPGYIISQKPASGVRVKMGSSVSVIVSEDPTFESTPESTPNQP